MRIKIFYFSATGNSLQIARNIAEELENCVIQSMAAYIPNKPLGGLGESIGFIFPVYFYGLPRLVKRFVEGLTISPNTYCFAIANSGGTRSNPLGMIDDILMSKGVRLSFADEIKMPGNYIVSHNSPKPTQVKRLITDASIRTKKIAKAILNCELRPAKQKVKLWSERINHHFLYKNTHKLDEKFIATDKCVGCGLCAKICPVNNIKIENHHPCWQHTCEQCLACIHWCPCEAIEYGRNTIGRTRYRNPNVKVEDIIRSCQGME
ncbi:EFR1 family ferrodoxin [Lacrimispora algidixylanolytica]|uniref:4Fe-4S ferredoxin-type domain-containing protein n=1 Tax=Lacrimispora algidixylanolytica TaxID=94868 RepID=A0A419T2T3_9FIRM|nr:EFR1 family ferrodoxin [Lacrimispora algidixylanolytica]RKD31827.1 hypothetical protein BET01_18835 [Lacrimispora algidixylanolytica]